MSEKGYANLINEGIQLYKRCLEAQTPKNKIKFAEKALSNLTKAVSYAKDLNYKDKISLLYEYITHINIIIGISHSELKDTEREVHFLNAALKSNMNATKNATQKERNILILSELAQISSRINQSELAINYANRALSEAKSLKPEEYLEYLISLNPIFIKGLDVQKVKSNYNNMVKLVKRSDNKQLKAQIYFDYSRYLFEVEKKYDDAKEYLEKVKTIYNSLGNTSALKFTEEYYNSKFDPNGKPILSNKTDKPN